MELSPRDLGTERYVAVMRKRLTPLAPQGTGLPPEAGAETGPLPRRLRKRVRGQRGGSRLRRRWVRDLNVDEETGEEVSAVLWNGTPGVGLRVGGFILTMYFVIGTIIAFAAGGAWVGVLLTLLWAAIIGAMLDSPRKSLKQADTRPLTAAEIEAMIPQARGRLDRQYLHLVLDALRRPAPSASAQSDVRTALRYLGDAIAGLPADPVAVVDPAQLRKEALEKRQAAQAENDSLVRASMLREADALERRAIVAQENPSARRSSALRREVRAQMDALRAILVAYDGVGQADTTAAAHLAESVQRAAVEAQAAALARRELEEGEIERLFGAPLPTPTTQTQTVSPTSTPQTTVTQQTEPQPQTISRGAWWRNNGGA